MSECNCRKDIHKNAEVLPASISLSLVLFVFFAFLFRTPCHRFLTWLSVLHQWVTVRSKGSLSSFQGFLILVQAFGWARVTLRSTAASNSLDEGFTQEEKISPAEGADVIVGQLSSLDHLLDCLLSLLCQAPGNGRPAIAMF